MTHPILDEGIVIFLTILSCEVNLGSQELLKLKVHITSPCPEKSRSIN